MPLPPRGDPQRPLRLASRWTLILGIVFAGVGAWSMMPILAYRMRAAGTPGAAAVLTSSAWEVIVGTMVIFFGPGALYIICSTFLKRRWRWAAVAAMAMAAVHLLLVVFGTTRLLMDAAELNVRVPWVPLVVLLVFLIALAQLEYHLARSFKAMRRPMTDEGRGFEPLSVTRALPESRHAETKDAAAGET